MEPVSTPSDPVKQAGQRKSSWDQMAPPPPPSAAQMAPPSAAEKRTGDQAFVDNSHAGESLPRVHWLSFGEESVLVQSGFRGFGPAIFYEKKHPIFNESAGILQEIVDMNAVELDHDEEWLKYPKIGEMFKN